MLDCFYWVTTIVGYQNIPVPNGFSFRTVTFNAINAEEFDLTDILPLQADGTEWAVSGAKRCLGAITIQKISTSGSYGQVYAFYSTKTSDVLDGWQVGSKTAKVGKGDVTFKSGEGMIISCSKDGALFQVAGAVSLEDTSVAIPNGFSFSGNCTPVVIDLLDILPLQADGTEWAATGAKRCLGAITVQKISTSGSYGQAYAFYSSKTEGVTDGWQVGSKTAKVVRGDVTFEPGEGFIVSCSKDAAIFKFPSPISE